MFLFTLRWVIRAVEFAFATPALRGICEKRNLAIKALDRETAHELKQRLADLEALANVAEFLALFPGVLLERSPAEMSVRLKSGYLLTFCSGHVNPPRTDSGATDWSKVTRIRFTELEGTNGG